MGADSGNKIATATPSTIAIIIRETKLKRKKAENIRK